MLVVGQGTWGVFENLEIGLVLVILLKLLSLGFNHLNLMVDPLKVHGSLIFPEPVRGRPHLFLVSSPLILGDVRLFQLGG